ncbi:MAG: septum site-determining protein MinC [Eubacterium sp.]|nr:septum site-determining protein MinC [Eubacterium sp.]
MKSSVIIKGNKYGFQIVLNPTLPFEELLREVAAKFKESIRFFDASQAVAVSFEGRSLTPGEQNLLVDTIVENSGLRISYIIDGAEAVETRFAQAIMNSQPSGTEERDGYDQPVGVKELYADAPEEEDYGADSPEGEKVHVQDDIITESIPENLVSKDGQFYRGTLRSGQRIEVDGSIVILGDINPGAMVVAGGNVVVLGCLKGSAYAGNPDDKSAFVASLMMEPMQIQIGSCIARSPDQKGKKARPGRKKKEKELEAKIAFVENDNIFIETITRSLINDISIV